MTNQEMCIADCHVRNIGEIGGYCVYSVRRCPPPHQCAIIADGARHVAECHNLAHTTQSTRNSHLSLAVVTPSHHRAICKQCEGMVGATRNRFGRECEQWDVILTKTFFAKTQYLPGH